MSAASKIVDGFRFMPPSLRHWIGRDIPNEEFSGHIPWTPLNKPLSEATFSLMTSAGINLKTDPPFDVEREKREPTWGDPSHREIPKTATAADIDVNHLHINTEYIKQDINVMLPLARFREFDEENVIGKLAATCYSYYGFQMDTKALIADTMPKVVEKMRKENVEAVLLTPA
jgi:D-proline reductase (dithiol) PrdB